jgi:hypothetical protein
VAVVVVAAAAAAKSGDRLGRAARGLAELLASQTFFWVECNSTGIRSGGGSTEAYWARNLNRCEQQGTGTQSD